MGYDLHITRRKYWSNEGNDISAAEWLAYIARDSELVLRPEQGPYFAEWNGSSALENPWLDWSKGQIYSKNPDPKLIDKMVSIARQFNAAVVGDDNEIYDAGDKEPRQPKPSLAERVAGWWAHYRYQRPLKIEHQPLPFSVGDTVVDSWGNEHTVIQIDPNALHGAGIIRTRSNQNGTEKGHMMTGHGLEPTARKNTL